MAIRQPSGLAFLRSRDEKAKPVELCVQVDGDLIVKPLDRYEVTQWLVKLSEANARGAA